MRSLLLRFFATVFVLVAVLIAAGCGGPHDGYGAPSVGGTPHLDRIELRVENHQMEDVTVYLVRQGTPIRIGVARGFDTRTFRILSSQYGDGSDLTLRVESRGSRSVYESPHFSVEAGQALRWTVNARPGLSSLAVVVPGGAG